MRHTRRHKIKRVKQRSRRTVVICMVTSNENNEGMFQSNHIYKFDIIEPNHILIEAVGQIILECNIVDFFDM